MSAEQLDVVIEQGTSFTQLWQVLDVDLTVATAVRAQFRGSHQSQSTVLSLVSPATLTVVKSGNHSHVTANVSATTTAALTAPARGVYDLEYVLAGVTVRAFEGSFYVTPEATK